MELKDNFDQAVINSKKLSEKPSNDILLQLYALFKQATIGDVTGDAPDNPFDFVAKAKYNAWCNIKGRSSETAMQEYVDLVNSLK